jgi:hypothetical protein
MDITDSVEENKYMYISIVFCCISLQKSMYIVQYSTVYYKT